MTYNLSWQYSGTLDRLYTNLKKGTYLFLYHQEPDNENRIIYVGTTKKTFSYRWGEHLNLFSLGKRTAWKPNANEDIYDLMIKSPEEYKILLKNGQSWIPDIFKDKKKDYNTYWLQYIVDEYLSKISVWYCEMNDNEIAKSVESKVQIALKKKFGIGNYKKSSNNCWLGKIEKTNESDIDNQNIHFEAFPPLAEETRLLLNTKLSSITRKEI